MKTIIFDFDGTIADSFELMLEIAEEIAGVSRPSDEVINYYKQFPLTKVVRELRIPIHRMPRLILQGRQKMHERIHEVRPFRGMPGVLEALHNRDDYQLLVMSSNSEQNVRTFLRANDLERFFDNVQGNVGVFNKAAALKKTMRHHHLDPKTCYYVGDEVRDVVAASRAGVEPVAVTWGYQAKEALATYHPFALVDKPSELLAVFTKRKL
ncbi:MAG TPA: HAD hydrolase-like protein [Candidatus Saccharimonadales bacterium]|nr:HAD hydrolase-like protein [Candidatus Saccharimonadales bacterium]